MEAKDEGGKEGQVRIRANLQILQVLKYRVYFSRYGEKERKRLEKMLSDYAEEQNEKAKEHMEQQEPEKATTKGQFKAYIAFVGKFSMFALLQKT